MDFHERSQYIYHYIKNSDLVGNLSRIGHLSGSTEYEVANE
jgi:hypothetical protein